MMKKPSYGIVRNARVFTAKSSADFSANWAFDDIKNGSLIIQNGLIAEVGSQQNLAQEYPDEFADFIIDAKGKLVTPGFVDCHTHPVFFQNRAHEFTMRVQGVSYVDISKAGGGIRFTVRNLREASEEQLLSMLLDRMDRFLSYGTTTVEAKSGYGLSLEDELKSLRVIKKANELHAVDLVPTFLGAHEIPDEFQRKREKYIDLVLSEMVPQVVENELAEFADIFCENHVFTKDESLRVLSRCAEAGLRPKIHADQLQHSGGTEVAIEVGAISADHLEHTPAYLDEKMVDAKVVPVMLPGADFFLASSIYGPARRMINSGLPVAIATDFNPGTCMCESMPMMMTLACLQLKLTPAEAFIASTYHAAKAVGVEKSSGILQAGSNADFIVWTVDSVEEIPYHFGVNLVSEVYKNGKRVFQHK